MIDYSKFDGHTPGPWHVSQSGFYVRKWSESLGGNDWNICTMNDKSDAFDANAALIAAAPDLLEENKRLREALGQILRMTSKGDVNVQPLLIPIIEVCTSILNEQK